MVGITGVSTPRVDKCIGDGIAIKRGQPAKIVISNPVGGWPRKGLLVLALILVGGRQLLGAMVPPIAPIGPEPGISLTTGQLESQALVEAISRELVFNKPIRNGSREAPSVAESTELMDILVRLRTTPNPALLEGFVRDHPQSGWTPSLRAHLAESYAEASRFSAALEQWAAAWAATRELDESPDRTALEESILVPWLHLLVRLGQVEQVELRLADCQGRRLNHPRDRQVVAAATEMLDDVRQHPGELFTCGTVALQKVVRALMPTNAIRCDAFLAYAPPTGFSLQALAEMARLNHWPLVAARRTSGWDLPVPSVIHWRQDHFAAILARRGATYLVDDPVLGGRRWLHVRVINEEASGNFLLSPAALSAAWKKLTAEEANLIHGRWAPNNVDDSQDEGCSRDPECCPAGMPVWWVTEPYINQWLADQPVFYFTSGGQRVAFELTFKQREWRRPPVINRFPDDLRSPGWNHSWLSYIRFADPTADDESRLIGWGFDKPVFGVVGDASLYLGSDIMTSGELGPLFGFPGYVIRHLRRSGEYAAFYEWQGLDEEESYWGYPISDVVNGYPRPAYTNFVADLYVAEGGVRSFHNTNIWGPFHARSKSELEPLPGLFPERNATNGFRLLLPDGAVDYYELVARSTNSLLPETAIAFRTRSIDPAGRTTRFLFETNGPPNRAPLVRLKYVVDSDGRTNTLDYDLRYPNLVTQVRDPHGRVVRMTYDDDNGFLTQIVDAMGITNRLRYCFVGGNPAVEELITPYGSTRFAFYERGDPEQGNMGGEDRLNRSVTVTGPDGSVELYCYRHQTMAPDLASLDEVLPDPGVVGQLDDGIGSEATDHIVEKVSANWRNSFYWSRRQFSKMTTTDPGSLTEEDYARARIRHWLAETNDPPKSLSACLSWERQPSPDGVAPGHFVFYGYPGKPANNAHQVGSDPDPDLVAERLPNSETRFTRYERNDLGYPTSVTSSYTLPEGGVGQRTWRFGYDPSNQIDLVSVCDPDGRTNTLIQYDRHLPVRIIAADGGSTFLQYDAVTRNLTRVQLPTGAVLEREYYPATPLSYPNAGYLKEERWLGYHTNSFAYERGLPRTHQNELGLTTVLTWDDLLRLRRVDYPDGTWISNRYTWLDLTATVDRLGQASQFSYDSRRRLVQWKNAAGHTNRWSYCECGDSPESFTNPLGDVTSWQYDDSGQVMAVLPPGLDTINYGRDALGRLIHLAQGNRSYTVEHNHQGLPVVVHGPAGDILRRTYDARDRVVAEADAGGVTVTRTFDALNRLLTVAWPNGTFQSWRYITGERDPYLYIDQLGQETYYLRDRLGQPTSVHHPHGEILSLGYAPDGQLRTLIDGNGQLTGWDFDEEGRAVRKWIGGQLAWTNGYNANGWLTGHFTPEKNLTRYAHDALGQVTAIDYHVSADVVLQYDSANRLTNLIDGVGSHRFAWTPWGGLASEDGPWSDDTISYGHDGARSRQTLTLQHSAATAWTQTYNYDAAGRLAGLASPAGAFTYAYEQANRRVSTLRRAGGTSTTNSYDALGRLLATLVLAPAGGVLDAHSYEYDLVNRRTRHRLGADHSWVFGYDPAGQLTSAQGLTGAGMARVAEQLSYSYDLAGNLASRQNGALQQSFPGITPQNQLGQITRTGSFAVSGAVQGNAVSVSVNGQTGALYSDQTFAVAGVPLVDGNNTFTALVQNATGQRATTSVNAWLPQTVHLQYDRNGNLTGDGRRSFEYDDANQLIAVQVTGEWRSEFQYDGFGRRRLSREFVWSGGNWTPASEVRYVCDGLLVLEERDGSNRPRATYTRGLDLKASLDGAGGIGGLLARSDHDLGSGAPATTTYFHSDAGGNITSLLDEQGQVVGGYQYDPFGNLLSQSGSRAESNPYRFSSKEFHERSGLYYFGYRFYDPNLQRWLTRDPLGEAGGINPYGFVGNQPTGRVDPDGLFWDTLWDAGNMAWDLGKVLWGRANDDGDLEKEGWEDLGLDAAAFVVPLVPAGASKLRRGASVLGRTAARLLNRGDDVRKTVNRCRAAAKSATQLEFGFVKNLENPNFVLYKSSEFNPSMLRPGEYTLNLPYLRNEALDWAQNQQALQRAMNSGNPIREANPNALGGWLQRERDFMSSQGWQRTSQGSDVFWGKPSGQ